MDRPPRHKHLRGMSLYANRKGFTLIELLIVIAIIGILSAIAIPMFLGQREKAKVMTVVSSAKGVVPEVQSVLDAYVSGDPFILLDTTGKETCYEALNATPVKRCSSMYTGMTAAAKYVSPPSGIDSIKQWIIDHHNGKNETSPYGDYLMFKSTATGNQGEIIITNQNAGLADDRKLWIIGYAADATHPIFNTTVTAR